MGEDATLVARMKANGINIFVDGRIQALNLPKTAITTSV
jgi:hypothetical protein